MSKQIIWLKIVVLYAAAFGCSFLANRYFNLGFLWSVYISVSAAANFLLFDEIIDVIDFDDIKRQEGVAKSVYILAVAVLAGCFAITSAMFLK